MLRHLHYFSFIIPAIQKQPHGQSHMLNNLSVLSRPQTNFGHIHPSSLVLAYTQTESQTTGFFHDS